MVKEGKTVGLRGVLLDITERKLMEANLLKSKHLAAVGETAAMVGHDLRNPLQGIKGAIYILKTMEDGLSEEGKGMLQMIEDGIQRSNKIIIDLLEYSRELYLEPSPSNAKSLIEQSLASVKIPENIRLVNQTKDQPFIEVDVEKIQRVCVNIMKNAVDAMPNGGTLTVTSRECDDKIELVFADTGEGIRDEILAKIWSPLFTTKAKGMGYGLAIVKRFVEAHGGTVHVQTKLNEGSAFTVSLPIKQKTTALFKPPLEDLAPAGIAWR
jgi:signal transduction histidine kinase